VRTRRILPIAAALVLGACGAGAAAPPPAPTPPPRGPEGSGEAVTIAFAGDASFEGLGQLVEDDPGSVLADVGPLLRGADLAVVNLEAVLGEAGSPVPKAFNFRVPAGALESLAVAGVDVVSMANNHGLDYGGEGLEESLRIERATGFPVIGVGQDLDEAYAPFTTEVRGQRIGVLAASDVIDAELRSSWIATDGQPGLASAEEPEQDVLEDRVRRLRAEVDTLVVYLHYGVERETCPNERQRELVDALVEAGADIVVGTHAHRLQGHGYLGDRYVAYGLGNFVFSAGSEGGRASGVLTVTATGRRIDGAEWAPTRIVDGRPEPLTGASADRALAEQDELRECADLSATPGDTGERPGGEP
jgi:poly-gamma-glutamate capsule biosynthesis protein CapA/YwtB (metallophosphatase superfamily)